MDVTDDAPQSPAPSTTATDRTSPEVYRRLRFITVTATFGGLLFGYDTGVISGALPFMALSPEEGGLGLTPLTEGIVASSLVLGAAFGALFGGRLCDRHGRKRTILGLAVLFFVGALGTALAPDLLPESTARSYLVLASMLTFLLFMQGCIATVFWLMLAEIFPLRLRGFAMGTAVLGTWVANFVVTLAFPPLIDAIGGATFLIFAAVNAVTLAYYVRTVPETRGRSMEAIESQFRRQFAT
ncbi:MFS transporter [Streptomyces sp. LARHCF252]